MTEISSAALPTDDAGQPGPVAPVGPVGGAVTLSEVARRAAVSAMTVSNVINGKPNVRPATRARVLAAIEASGYRVNPLARALAGGRGRMVSVYASRLNQPYAMEVVQGAAQAADALGYDLVVMMLGAGGPSADLSVMGRLAVGALMIQPNGSDLLRAADLPPHVVSIDGPGERRFTVDNYGGACLATRHLLDLGHRRIGFIGGLGVVRLPNGQQVPDTADRDDGAERLRGFLDTMTAAGLKVPGPHLQTGDYSKASGERAAGRLLGLKRPPTAPFVSGDAMALGAMHAAQDRGLSVPADLSLVGFDDLPIAAASRPALSTVRQPLQEMGDLAVRMLAALVEGHSPPLPPPFPARLVARESTAPPPDF